MGRTVVALWVNSVNQQIPFGTLVHEITVQQKRLSYNHRNHRVLNMRHSTKERHIRGDSGTDSA